MAAAMKNLQVKMGPVCMEYYFLVVTLFFLDAEKAAHVYGP